MLAVAAAVHGGHIPIQILILLAAVALAMFWRALLKVGVALIVIVVALVIVKGDLVILHLLHLLIP
jgi:hypothetical protein